MVLRLSQFGLGCLYSSLGVGHLLGLVLVHRCIVLWFGPANCEKSTMTSARSAGASSSECFVDVAEVEVSHVPVPVNWLVCYGYW